MLTPLLTYGPQRDFSAYPFAVLSGGKTSICLAVPLLEQPRLFRLYARRPFVGEAILGCEFEVGLSPVTQSFPSGASYRFIICADDATWAFRRAVAAYYRHFPEQFDCVEGTHHGNWSVLYHCDDIPNIGDFEIGTDVTHLSSPPADPNRFLQDRLAGIDRCQYMRPGTWSQEFRGDSGAPDAYEVRMARLAEEAQMPPWARMFPNPWWGSSLPELVAATRTSGIHDIDGRLEWRWNVSHRPGHFFSRCQQNTSSLLPSPNWAEALERQYTCASRWAERAGVGPIGAYMDNLGAGSINAFDFRRDHWRVARFPLVVNAEPPQPAQSKYLQLAGFFPEFARVVHERGGVMIGNFHAAAAFALSPWFDVIGHEEYVEDGIERLRIMAGQRPASFGIHAEVTREMFENCLCYGVWPGVREVAQRELYAEFAPLIRELSVAGWRPVPHARCDLPNCRLEHFGDFRSGSLTFTVLTQDQQSRRAAVTVSVEDLGIDAGAATAIDMRRDRVIDVDANGDHLNIPLTLEPGRTEVVRICRPEEWERTCLRDILRAVERAGREWAWIRAQHEGELTAHLDFEADDGRWFRFGFDGGQVGLTDEGHTGAAALLIEAESAEDGTIKTEPFVIRDVPQRVSLFYRAGGLGRVTAKIVLLPYAFAGEPVGEVELGKLGFGAVWPDRWRRWTASVDTPGKAKRLYLQLDFSGFRGRFALDSFALTPVFEPLAETPEFGFADMAEALRAELQAGRHDEAAAVVETIPERVQQWRAAAQVLGPGHRERMVREVALVEAAADRWIQWKRN